MLFPLWVKVSGVTVARYVCYGKLPSAEVTAAVARLRNDLGQSVAEKGIPGLYKRVQFRDTLVQAAPIVLAVAMVGGRLAMLMA